MSSFLGLALEEMLLYCHWTRLSLKNRAEVGVVFLSRTSCLLLLLQLLQGTRNLKEGFLPSAFMEQNSLFPLTLLPLMSHVVYLHMGVWRQVLKVSCCGEVTLRLQWRCDLTTYWPPLAQWLFWMSPWFCSEGGGGGSGCWQSQASCLSAVPQGACVPL